MQRVLVLSSKKEPLMPCHPARARELLKKGKAAVYRAKPFTLILKEREFGQTQAIELKVDPGSQISGLSVVGDFKRGLTVLMGINLEHRGLEVKRALEQRRHIRRSRRNRKTRYRKARFLNRARPEGWLPPSLASRVDNVVNTSKKLQRFVPLKSIVVETVRFDTQKLDNPEISGIQYQQGILQGYEVREYLLEKWQRQCAYCDIKEVPLEVEHIVPRTKGGTNRISNLTLSCRKCNVTKGSQDIQFFLKGKPKKLQVILAQAKASLKDAIAVNATRYRIGDDLKTLGLPVSFWSGGRTKYNRVSKNYPKDHWVDAACVGESGEKVYISPKLKPLHIKACGRGTRQMCRVNRFGFPRTKPKKEKRVYGFQTGDLVKAIVPSGKKEGTYTGRVAVRSTGNFNIKQLKETVQGISHRFCTLSQRTDGYAYAT